MSVEQLEDRLTPYVNSLFSFGAPLTSVGQQIGTALIPVLRSDSSGTASVAITALDDSALNGVDYNFTNQTLNFADGQSEVDVSVGIVETGVWQTSQFELSLSSPSSGYGIDSTLGSTTVQILPATWTPPADITYGTALSATQLDPTTEVAGSWSFSPAAGTVLNAGANQTLSGTFTPSDDTLDPITFSTAINVLQATPSITWTPTNITYGTDLSSNADASADVGGTFSYSFDTTDILNAGTHQALSVTFTPTDSTDYTTASQTIYIDVGQANAWISGIGAGDKSYDATTAATLTGLSSAELHGIRAGDDVSLDTSSAAGTFAGADAADSVTVSISGLALSGAQAGNYHLESISTSADITPIALTVVADPQSVVYGGTVPSLTYQLTSGAFVGSDGFSGALTSGAGNPGAALDHDDGIDTGSFTIAQGTLTADSNYAITFQEANLTVTPKALLISSGVSANSKIYDGTTTATLSFNSPRVTGIVGNDEVSVDTSSAYSAAFTSPVVGTAIPVTVSALGLTGAQADDYTLTQPSLTADVSQATLTISGITGTDKTYDGTTADAITGTLTLVGIIGNNLVTLNSSEAAANFTDQNAGSGRTVLFGGFTLGGADAGNYTLDPGSSSADIAPIALTVTADPQSAVYGSIVQTLTYGLTSGALLAGDSFTGALTSEAGNAGATLSHDNGIDVGSYAIAQGTLTAGGNYVITFVSDSLAVTAKALTISSGVSADGKTYDGSTTATLSFNSVSLSGVLGSDQVSMDTSSVYSANFDDSGAGTGKPVTIADLGLTGAQSGDYSLIQPALSGTVNPAPPVISISDAGGMYNGTAMPATATIAGVVSGYDDTSGSVLEGVSLITAYYPGTAASGTPLSGAPCMAGVYTAQATFAGSSNYANGTVAATFTIGLNVSNPGDQVNFDGDSIDFGIVTTGTTNQLSYSAANLPSGVTIDSSGVISGAIASTAHLYSAYSVSVAVTDTTLGVCGTTTFNWSVTQPVTVLSNPGDQAANDGDSLALPIGATETSNHVITYSATGLPGGPNIDASTGVISGTIADSADLNSPYSVTISALDSAANVSDTMNFVWTVSNSDPTAQDNTYYTSLNNAYTFNLIENTQHATQTAVPDGPYDFGLQQNDDGTYTFTPTTDLSGSFSFTFVGTRGDLVSNTATITFVVAPSSPICVTGVSYSTVHDQPLSILTTDLLANDAAQNANPLQLFDYDQPVNGIVNTDGDGNLIYTPNAGFVGSDSFNITVTDGTNFANAQVTIQVTSQFPDVPDQYYDVQAGTTFTMSTPAVPTTDGDGVPIALTLIQSPTASQQFSYNPDGTFIYTPKSGFQGTEYFSYNVTNGVVTNTVVVQLQVGLFLINAQQANPQSAFVTQSQNSTLPGFEILAPNGFFGSNS